MKSKNNRLTNFEVLRIVAMLMIVIYHIVCHCIQAQLNGGDLAIKAGSAFFNNPVFHKKLFVLNGIMVWGSIGNAIFLLISGYFLVHPKKEININKISKKLLLQLGFASMALVILSAITYKLHITDQFIQLIDINSFNSMSWYVGYYFLVILIAYLFLNKYLKKLSKKQYITFLIITFALTQFFWTNQIINGFSNGLSILLIGIFLYSLGGYINKYNPFDKFKIISILLVMLITNLFIYISSYNIITSKIEKYLLGSTKGFSQSLMSFENNSILVIIMSVCLFEFFSRMKIRNIKIINYLASGTFMVYLIHDNEFFYSMWGTIDWLLMLCNNPLKFVVILLAVGLLTFTVGIIIYILYNLTIKIGLKYKNIFLKN